MVPREEFLGKQHPIVYQLSSISLCFSKYPRTSVLRSWGACTHTHTHVTHTCIHTPLQACLGTPACIMLCLRKPSMVYAYPPGMTFSTKSLCKLLYLVYTGMQVVRIWLIEIPGLCMLLLDPFFLVVCLDVVSIHSPPHQTKPRAVTNTNLYSKLLMNISPHLELNITSPRNLFRVFFL